MRISHVFIDCSYGKLSGFRGAWSAGSDETSNRASSLKDAYNIAQAHLKTQASLL